MRRIEGPHARVVEGKTLFQEADPSIDPPKHGTKLTAEWCNSMQEEICTVIEKSGSHLDSGKTSQLDEAIDSKIEILSKKLDEVEKQRKVMKSDLDRLITFSDGLYPVGSLVVTTQSLDEFQKTSVGKIGKWIVHPNFKERYFRAADGCGNPHLVTLGNSINSHHLRQFLDECEINGQGTTIWEKPIFQEKICEAPWRTSTKEKPHKITSFKKECSQTQITGSIQSPEDEDEARETRPDTVYVNVFYRES